MKKKSWMKTISFMGIFVFACLLGNNGIVLGVDKKSKVAANYYPTDDLYGPKYDLCRNLVQNPSFEAGYRYWRQFSQNFPNPDNFCIDSDISYKGKKSLRLYGRKGQRVGMGYPSTFAIPVEPGEMYTLSFYAKIGRASCRERV